MFINDDDFDDENIIEVKDEVFHLYMAKVTYYKNDFMKVELDHCTKFCKKGRSHRKNGPAIERKDGGKCWYIDGQLHRVDGPAVEESTGYKAWYVNGQLHRVDGPAIESGNYKEWWLNGKLHRKDGPAIISLNKNLYAVEGYECFEVKEGNIVMIEGKAFFKSPIEYIEY